MYKIVAIGGHDFCAGFALAGIDTRLVTESSAEATFTSVLSQEDLALVILDEQWHASLERLRPDTLQARLPIVIPVPAQMRWRDVEQPEEDHYIGALIRQAVGYQLDIEL